MQLTAHSSPDWTARQAGRGVLNNLEISGFLHISNCKPLHIVKEVAGMRLYFPSAAEIVFHEGSGLVTKDERS